MRIAVSSSGVEELAAELGALPDQTRRATRSAIRRTIKWAHGQARKAVAEEVGVAQKLISARVRMSSGDDWGQVWISLMPVAVKQSIFPRMRQTQAGVSVLAKSRYQFGGAFIATMPSGLVGAFKRRGNRRLPIDLQKIEINTPDMMNRLQTIQSGASGRFVTDFRRELNYQVFFRGSR